MKVATVKKPQDKPLTWHQQRAADSRLAILNAAQNVFLRAGYAASMDTLAEGAGVSRRTLYKQFGSKEAIFRAIMERMSEEYVSPMLHLIEEQGDMIDNIT